MGLKLLLQNKFWFFFFFLTVLALVPIWVVTNPPFQDYPGHLFSAHVIKEYDNPELEYNQYYILKQFPPPPYTIFYFLLVNFSYALPLFLVGKILLSIYIILFPLSVYYFVSAFNKANKIFSLFSFLFIYNNALGTGVINFLLGMCLFFFSLGYWWKIKDKLDVRNATVLSILSIFLYLTHLFTFLLFILALFVLSFLHYKNLKSPLKYTALTLPSFFLLFWFLLSQKASRFSLTSITFNYNLKSLFYALFGALVSFTPKHELLLLFVPLCVLIYLFIKSIFRVKNHLYFLIFLLLILTFLLPIDLLPFFLGFQSRLIPIILVLCLPCLAGIPQKKEVLFKLMLVLFFSSFIILTSFNYYKMDREIIAFQGAAKLIPLHQNVLVISPPVGLIAPYHHISAYYYIATGSVGPIFSTALLPLEYSPKWYERNNTSFGYIYIIGVSKEQIPPNYNLLFSKENGKLYKKW